VINVGEADEDLTDEYKHCILAGENYIECQYLEKTREIKKNIQYKKLATKVYITPNMVMSPDVRITSDYVTSSTTGIVLLTIFSKNKHL
jgi:hypothetical protein